MTKLTITVNYSLKELKEKYRLYFDMAKSEKITKKDIADWMGVLIEGDVAEVEGED